KVKKDYVVIYMFDDMPLDKIVNKILDETNYDIYLFPFGNVKNDIFKNKRIHNACRVSGPIEFVYLIGHAKLVLANSLHALAFSINMNTPFVIFNRDELDEEHSINSRMRSMTRMFKFESRILSFDKFYNEKLCNVVNLNFGVANEILKAQRNKSFKYLKEALMDE
ncbi:MAG: polysaccharide pyruvyl transferase family protein, partial [archaeon]|nr:polysaccharide pyruvyl transferase family protein [archaeon]